jgi:hypothetical protein
MLLECPLCKARGISAVRKLSLGPGVTTRCSNCQQKIGLSRASLLLILPGLVLLFLLNLGWHVGMNISLSVVWISLFWLVLVPYLILKWVPLVPK